MKRDEIVRLGAIFSVAGLLLSLFTSFTVVTQAIVKIISYISSIKDFHITLLLYNLTNIRDIILNANLPIILLIILAILGWLTASLGHYFNLKVLSVSYWPSKLVLIFSALQWIAVSFVVSFYYSSHIPDFIHASIGFIAAIVVSILLSLVLRPSYKMIDAIFTSRRYRRKKMGFVEDL